MCVCVCLFVVQRERQNKKEEEEERFQWQTKTSSSNTFLFLSLSLSLLCIFTRLYLLSTTKVCWYCWIYTLVKWSWSSTCIYIITNCISCIWSYRQEERVSFSFLIMGWVLFSSPSLSLSILLTNLLLLLLFLPINYLYLSNIVYSKSRQLEIVTSQ